MADINVETEQQYKPIVVDVRVDVPSGSSLDQDATFSAAVSAIQSKLNKTLPAGKEASVHLRFHAVIRDA